MDVSLALITVLFKSDVWFLGKPVHQKPAPC